jgi:alpha-glucosidase
MKKIALLLFILCLVTKGVAQKFTTKINLAGDEKWYGAFTAKAYCNTPLKDITFLPYGANEKKKDLRIDNRGNQAAPLLTSNKGRYVWSEEPFVFEFNNGTLIIESDFEQVKVIATNGKTLRDAYIGAKDKHFPSSGKTLNPMMYKNPQYNTWIELGTNQNQKDLLKYTNDVIKNGFPTGVFMVDDGWANYYGNFEFDLKTFPDAKGMMDEIHDKGFKTMLWLTPFVSPDSREFKELSKLKALVLKKDSKQPALIKWWNGYSACIDFSKPAGVNWLRSKLKSLQERYGIDGYKFDAADFDFYKAWPEGSKAPYPNEDTNTTGPIQAEFFNKFGAEFDFNEFRAGWKNGNQPIAQRLQDKRYSWDDLKLLVPDMLSAGLIGHPNTCPDMIGGGLLMDFENIDYKTFDQELMVRSAQTQALMPMMQFSVAPWRVLDKKHLEIVRESALLHAKMGDYIYELALKAANDGEPIIRHLEYAFPNEGFESCDDQFMLGEKYLVTPINSKGFTRNVKLPKGNWIDELGNKFEGGNIIKIDVPIERLPYFIKE